MSVRIIAQLNPFTTDREEFQFSEGMTIQEILDTLNIDTNTQKVYIGLLNENVTGLDYIPMPDEVVYLNVVPTGDTNDVAAGAFFVLGAAVSVLGVVTANPFLFYGGVVLAGLGAGIAVNEWIKDATEVNIFGAPETTSPSYLRGGKNIIGKGQPIPLILGRHRYYPMQASTPKVAYVGKDYDKGVIGNITWEIEDRVIPSELRDVRMETFTQQLDQVYLLGHKEVQPIVDTYKRGDSPITDLPGTQVQHNSTALYGTKASKYINVGKRLDAYNADGYSTVETILQSGTTSVDYNLQLISSYCTYQKDSKTEPVQKEVISLVLVQLTNKTTESVEYTTSLKLYGGEGTKSDPTKSVSFTATIPHALNPDDVYSLSITRGDDRVDDKASPLYRGEGYSQSANLVYTSATCHTPNDVLSPNAKTAYSYLGVRVTDQVKSKGSVSELTGEINDLNLVVQTHIPVYSGVGSGAASWTNVQASSNPAALFLYVLQGSPNVRKVADEDIDWESLEEWYTFCEANSLECNLVLDKPGAVLAILKLIALCGRASFYLTEKYGVLVEKEKALPTLLLTDKNTKGLSTQRNISPNVHGYVCSIVNEEKDIYTENELSKRIYRSGYNADGSDGKKQAKYMERFTIAGVTNADQMYALARFFLNVSERRNQTVTTTMDWEQLLANTGDLVNVSFDELLQGLARGRIKEITRNVSNQVISLLLDEEVSLEAGNAYGVTVRYSTGQQVTFPVNNTEEITQTVTLETPLDADLEVDDLYAFGIVTKITGQYIIASITPAEELAAQLTLVPYAPEIYTIGDLPAYVSNITQPSLNRNIGTISEPFTPTELSQKISSNISNVDSLLNSSTKYAVKTGVPIAQYLRTDVLTPKLSLNNLYYINKDDLKLYRSGTVNANEAPTLIIDKVVKEFDVDEDDTFIIYSDIATDNSLWKYEIESDVHTQLTTSVGTNPVVSGDNIYYINHSDEDKIYSTTLSGGEGVIFLDHPASMMSVYNGNLFWVDPSTGYLVSRNKDITDITAKGDLFSTTGVKSIVATNPVIWSNSKVSSVPMYVEVASNIAFVNKEAFYGDVIKHDMNSQGDYTFVDSSGELYYVSLFDERTQARLEAETETETDEFIGDIVNGDYRITGLNGEALTKIVVNDSISGTGIQGNTRVTYKGNGYITLNNPAGESATGRIFTVFGTRLVLSANRVIIPGTVTAGLLEANAMSSIAVVPDDALVEENRGKPLFSHNHLTGVEERYDEDGKLLFQFTPENGLSLSEGVTIGGTIVPINPEFTDTNTTNTIYRQEIAPTSNLIKNDQWFDTDDKLLYVYSGTDWELIGPSSLGDLDGNADTKLDNIAEGATKNIINSVAFYVDLPTTGNTTGDLGVAADTAATYKWSGTAWGKISDKTSEYISYGGNISQNGTDGYFSVNGEGQLSCNDAIIHGTLEVGTSTTDVSPGNPGFKVESDGSVTCNNITANNGTFSGTINSSSGTIGGCFIGELALTAYTEDTDTGEQYYTRLGSYIIPKDDINYTGLVLTYIPTTGNSATSVIRPSNAIIASRAGDPTIVFTTTLGIFDEWYTSNKGHYLSNNIDIATMAKAFSAIQSITPSEDAPVQVVCKKSTGDYVAAVVWWQSGLAYISYGGDTTITINSALTTTPSGWDLLYT